MRFLKDMLVGERLELAIADGSQDDEKKRVTVTLIHKRGRRARLAVECLESVEVEVVDQYGANSAVTT